MELSTAPPLVREGPSASRRSGAPRDAPRETEERRGGEGRKEGTNRGEGLETFNGKVVDVGALGTHSVGALLACLELGAGLDVERTLKVDLLLEVLAERL